MTGSVNITGSLCINGDCYPFSGSGVNTGSFLITASYSNPNLTFTKGDGSTFNVNIGSQFAQTASFISVFDTTDQTLDGSLTASVFEFNNVDFNRGITLVSSSQFTLSQGGAYNLQFSAQLDKTTGTKHNSYFWLRKNGTDVSQSNTIVTMGGGSSDKAVAAWNFFVSGSAGDYYEIAWTADSTQVFLNAGNAAPGVYPAIPSIIATMNSMY